MLNASLPVKRAHAEEFTETGSLPQATVIFVTVRIIHQ